MKLIINFHSPDLIVNTENFNGIDEEEITKKMNTPQKIYENLNINEVYFEIEQSPALINYSPVQKGSPFILSPI